MAPARATRTVEKPSNSSQHARRCCSPSLRALLPDDRASPSFDHGVSGQYRRALRYVARAVTARSAVNAK